MNPDQKISQYLNEAHALEGALLQTLSAHIAMTPRSEYRSLLERHVDETREHAERLLRRLADLDEAPGGLQVVYGVAQTAVGQMLAAAKFPLDLLRGSGGEEKLLKNAKDEVASEALEIATYDALEALAEAAGDDETAELAREHRADEEAFLSDLRELLPQLARDVLGASGGSVSPSLDLGQTGAVEAARSAASEVRESVDDAAERVSRRARDTARRIPAPEPASPRPGGEAEAPAGGAEAPIEGYEELTVEQILPKLRLLTATELARVEEFERAHRGRKRVLDRVAKLREQTNGHLPARPR
jgi:ferritin-like metal-binding protein YciE